jgi:hypothetical protein
MGQEASDGDFYFYLQGQRGSGGILVLADGNKITPEKAEEKCAECPARLNPCFIAACLGLGSGQELGKLGALLTVKDSKKFTGEEIAELSDRLPCKPPVKVVEQVL